jgi:hypothetical protein
MYNFLCAAENGGMISVFTCHGFMNKAAFIQTTHNNLTLLQCSAINSCRTLSDRPVETHFTRPVFF